MKKKSITNIFTKDQSYNRNLFSIFLNHNTEGRYYEELLKQNIHKIHYFCVILIGIIVSDFTLSFSEICSNFEQIPTLILSLLLLVIALKKLKETSSLTTILSIFTLCGMHFWIRCLHIFEDVQDTIYVMHLYQLMINIFIQSRHLKYILCSLSQKAFLFVLNISLGLQQRGLLPSMQEFAKSYYLVAAICLLLYHFIFVQVRKHWVVLDSVKKSDKIYQHMFLESLAPELIIDINHRVVCINQVAKRIFNKKLLATGYNFMNVIDSQ